jgi:hypothetical protein
MKVRDNEAFGDSKLVVDQVKGDSQCRDSTLNYYLDRRIQLIDCLDSFQIEHVSWEHNETMNNLAQHASGYEIRLWKFYSRKKAIASDVHGVENTASGITTTSYAPEDWRQPLHDCIAEPRRVLDRKIRTQALKYTLTDGELYRRMVDSLLLKCLSDEQAKMAMGEVREGMCGTH